MAALRRRTKDTRQSSAANTSEEKRYIVLTSSSRDSTHSLSAPVLRNRVTNLPPLESPHWRAPGGQSEPHGNPGRVCSDDLQEAALRGDLGLVRRLIQAGASVNSPIRALGDDEYMTLPHMLAAKPEIPNGTRILAEIVESTANPNVRSSLGRTPLMLACLNKNVGAVEVLLGCGSRMDPVNDSAHTALRCAMIVDRAKPTSEALSAEIATLLCNASADLDDGGGLPPITEAVLQNNGEGVSTLLSMGATAAGLHEAVTQAPLTIIRMLVDREANPFVRDAEGRTVMEAALARGNDDITTLLRDYIGNLERSQHPHLLVRRLDEEDSLDGHHKNRHKRRTEEDDEHALHVSVLAKKCMRFQQSLRHFYKGTRFQIFMFVVLLLALYLPDLWVITSATNTEALDWTLVGIFSVFIVEFLLQLVGEWSTYFLGFAFWMDIVGVLSVPLDHSLVTNLLMSNVDLEGATLIRATKIVKLGVRSVRFSRLVKLIRFLPEGGGNAVGSTAKKMAGILGKKVSITVSCLIIICVIVIPTIDFFMFPEEDNAMLAWTTLFHRAAHSHSADLPSLVFDFEQFYKDLSFFPFELGYTVRNGTNVAIQLSGRVPERTQDVLRIKKESADGQLATWAYFNFRAPNRTDSICNCLLITAIILIMFTAASLVTHSVSKIVLLPLERLLSVVQSIAGQIFTSVRRMCGRWDHDDDDSVEGNHDGEDSTGFSDETKLIEKVLKKLAALSEITARRMPIDDFEQIDEENRAMLQDFAVNNHSHPEEGPMYGGQEKLGFTQEETSQAWKQLQEEGVELTSLERWDFHVGDISEHQRLTFCTCLLLVSGGPTVHGSGSSSSRTSAGMESTVRCRSFVETVCNGHGNPDRVKYHNWLHACDVTFTAWRCLTMTKAEHFLAVHERFALIVAAMCHDMGHPGYNNAFLVETSHELAIRYNDSSPLEQMHCSRLFQIAASAGTDIFVNLQRQRFREVRQVCIESILHTDNQQHYQLLSELQVTCETYPDLFDAIGESYEKRPEEYPSSDAIDFYCAPVARKLIRSFFLHFVDISNAMKPWKLCKFWAELVFEEFFSQGDSEKAMGIPVQPLNDRENVNKPHVQLGFTEFFVAPLANIVARWMPPLRICEDTCQENLEKWMRKWLDTEPDMADQDRFADRISKLRSVGQSRVVSQIGPWGSGGR